MVLCAVMGTCGHGATWPPASLTLGMPAVAPILIPPEPVTLFLVTWLPVVVAVFVFVKLREGAYWLATACCRCAQQPPAGMVAAESAATPSGSAVIPENRFTTRIPAPQLAAHLQPVTRKIVV